MQSVLIYASVARVPVAVALLVFNLFPVVYLALNGLIMAQRPPARTLAMAPLLLLGLALVVDPQALWSGAQHSAVYVHGVLFALAAATTFGVALWIADKRLNEVDGAVRAALIKAAVALLAAGFIISDIAPDLARGPSNARGAIGLTLLALLYAVAFCSLFVLMPRLNMQRNAPILNVEPVATLGIAWVVLGQSLRPIQLAGVACVMRAVVVMGKK